MKMKSPAADDKAELAGRIYQAFDLQKAIESGQLKTIEDVLAWSRESATALQAVINLPVWVFNEGALVDIQASIEHNQGSEQPQHQPVPNTAVISARVHYVNCPLCEAEQQGFVGDPRGGDFECDACNSVYHVPENASIVI